MGEMSRTFYHFNQKICLVLPPIERVLYRLGTDLSTTFTRKSCKKLPKISGAGSFGQKVKKSFPRFSQNFLLTFSPGYVVKTWQNCREVGKISLDTPPLWAYNTRVGTGSRRDLANKKFLFLCKISLDILVELLYNRRRAFM